MAINVSVTVASALAHVMPMTRTEAAEVLATGGWANGCRVSVGEEAALRAMVAGNAKCTVPLAEAQANGMELAVDTVRAAEFNNMAEREPFDADDDENEARAYNAWRNRILDFEGELPVAGGFSFASGEAADTAYGDELGRCQGIDYDRA